jgi:lysophospholipase L1-like esterase
VETITVSQAGGGSAAVDVGFYVTGAHSCFLAQSVDGTYNSTQADLSAVATWVNLGTSALNVTQETGSAQPTYRTAFYGQQPAITCDGGDKVQAATAADWTFLHTGVDTTIDAVSRWSAGTTTAVVSTMTGSANTALGARVSYLSSSSGRTFYNVGNGTLSNFLATTASSSGASNILHNQTATLNDDGGAGIDATIVIDATTATASRANAYSALDGNPLALCANPAGTADSLTGDLFAVLVYSTALSATESGITRAVHEWALGGTFPITVAALPSPPGAIEDRWVFLGDSITAGSGETPWPTQLSTLHLPVGWTSDNYAVTSTTTTAHVAQWYDNTPDYPTVVFVLGGVNDINTGRTAAQAFANLTYIYQSAQSVGVTVVALLNTPWENAAVWSAPEQVETDALNALIAASTDVDFVVDVYTALEDPGNPDAMLAAFDSGDGLHPSEAGAAMIATTVATALGL